MTHAQLAAGAAAARAFADQRGISSWVSDADCRALASAIIAAALGAQDQPDDAPTEQQS